MVRIPLSPAANDFAGRWSLPGPCDGHLGEDTLCGTVSQLALPRMQLNTIETAFVDAVRRDFAFLITDRGFTEQPLDWNGRGISVVHLHPSLKIRNYLEADVFYELRITPLRDGRAPDPFDEQMNRAFVDFTIDELVQADQATDWASATNSQYPDVEQLEAAVAVRASALRQYLGVLLTDDHSVVGLVRDRLRERQLSSLTVGSGTTLIECGLLGTSALGTDINPAAVYGARTGEFMNRPHEERPRLLSRLCDRLREAARTDQGGAFGIADIVAGVRRDLSRLEMTALANSLMLALGPDGKDTTAEVLFAAFQRYREICLALPWSSHSLSATEADARALPLGSESTPLVVTSPPYVNVFNYHQHFRRAAEMLGHKPLDAARSEIGSNRKHRGNRFLTVVQYCLDMTDAFREIRRVMKPSGTVVVVVGRESNVRGCRFENGRALFCLAAVSGLALETRMERVFTSRYGTRVYEDILVLKVTEPRPWPESAARMVARIQLEKALSIAQEEVRQDVRDAIAASDSVQSSPLLAGPGLVST